MGFFRQLFKSKSSLNQDLKPINTRLQDQERSSLSDAQTPKHFIHTQNTHKALCILHAPRAKLLQRSLVPEQIATTLRSTTLRVHFATPEIELED